MKIKIIIAVILTFTFLVTTKIQETIITTQNALKITERIKQSSISIFNISGNGAIGNCSGVLVRQKEGLSHILTAKHCIGLQEEMYVENTKVELIIASQNDDLAYLIVRGELKNKIPIKLAYDNSKLGETIYHISYPDFDAYVSSGKVLKNTKDWQIARIRSGPGCSGGGIFNKNSELVGILWGGIGFEDIALYESIEDIHIFLKTIEVYTKWINR